MRMVWYIMVNTSREDIPWKDTRTVSQNTGTRLQDLQDFREFPEFSEFPEFPRDFEGKTRGVFRGFRL